MTHFLMLSPLLCEVANHTYASRAVASTHAALVELKLGADDAVAAGAHALALHAHGAAVRTTFGPVCHLNKDPLAISDVGVVQPC